MDPFTWTIKSRTTSSVPIQDIALKTYRERWMMETGGWIGSGRSVLVVLYDDDDDDDHTKNCECATQNLSWRIWHKVLWDFEIQTDHLISARRPDLIIINKKERTCRFLDFAVPVDHRVELKESKKKDKYLDFGREMKKIWNMKVIVIPIVIGYLSRVTKGFAKGLEDMEITGRMETVQTTALLRSARILWRVQETWSNLLSPKLLWKTISKRWREKLDMAKKRKL